MRKGGHVSISLQRQGAIARVRLDDGQMNLFTFETVRRLHDACVPLLEDQAVRVIVLESGRPNVWSAGADLAEFVDPARDLAGIAGWYYDTADLARRFLVSDKLVVAALSRSVVGVAAALVLACDFRIVSTRANFFLPEARLGLVAPLFSAELLVPLVGLERAKRILIACPKIAPQEAQAIGLASEVIDFERYGEGLEPLLAELAERDATAVGILKRQLRVPITLPESRDAFVATAEAGMPAHWGDFLTALRSPAARSGIRRHLAAHGPA